MSSKTKSLRQRIGQGLGSFGQGLKKLFRGKTYTFEELKANVESDYNKFEDIKKAMGEFTVAGFTELHTELTTLHEKLQKLQSEPPDADLKNYSKEYREILSKMRTIDDKAMKIISEINEKQENITKATGDDKKKLEGEMNELREKFNVVIQQKRSAFYNQWWFKLLVGIVIIIGVIFIIGVIVGFIYAYHAESIHFSKTGEWSNARIIKRSAMNWVYVAIFWSQYGIW